MSWLYACACITGIDPGILEICLGDEIDYDGYIDQICPNYYEPLSVHPYEIPCLWN